MPNYGTLVISVLFLIVIMLLVALVSGIMSARQEIAKYNEGVAESCLFLECDVSPFGALECSYYEPDISIPTPLKIQNHSSFYASASLGPVV